MMPRPLAIVFAMLALTACSKTAEDQSTTGAKVADQLEGAAAQSGPAAKEVLETAAAEAREQPSMAPAGEPGSFAQDAMSKAGKAEAETLSSGRPEAQKKP